MPALAPESYSPTSPTRTAPTSSVCVGLGLSHCAVEAICSWALTWHLFQSDAPNLNLILLYNSLAFCAQPAVGWIADVTNTARSAAIVGCALVFTGVMAIGRSPAFAVAGLGLGNACFHIGAGTAAIRRARGTLSNLGVFVGSGSIGLAVGKCLGAAGHTSLACVALLLLGTVSIGFVRMAPLERQSPAAAFSGIRPSIVLVLVFICIALRSVAANATNGSGNSTRLTVLAGGTALAAGKIVGALAADRIGWCAVSMWGLAMSSVLICVGNTVPALGILGTGMSQIPMAVTLGLAVRHMTNRPALAFGLASAAIYGGAYLRVDGMTEWLRSDLGVGSLTALTMALLAVAIGLSGRIERSITARKTF